MLPEWDYVEECRQTRDLIINEYQDEIMAAAAAGEKVYYLPKAVYRQLKIAYFKYEHAFQEASRSHKMMGAPPEREMAYITPYHIVIIKEKKS